MLFFRPTAVPLPVRGNGMLIEPPGGGELCGSLAFVMHGAN